VFHSLGKRALGGTPLGVPQGHKTQGIGPFLGPPGKGIGHISLFRTGWVPLFLWDLKPLGNFLWEHRVILIRGGSPPLGWARFSGLKHRVLLISLFRRVSRGSPVHPFGGTWWLGSPFSSGRGQLGFGSGALGCTPFGAHFWGNLPFRHTPGWTPPLFVARSGRPWGAPQNTGVPGERDTMVKRPFCVAPGSLSTGGHIKRAGKRARPFGNFGSGRFWPASKVLHWATGHIKWRPNFEERLLSLRGRKGPLPIWSGRPRRYMGDEFWDTLGGTIYRERPMRWCLSKGEDTTPGGAPLWCGENSYNPWRKISRGAPVFDGVRARCEQPIEMPLRGQYSFGEEVSLSGARICSAAGAPLG